MSISEVVDYEYRLLPGDLGGKPRRVTIANVTYQGVEELTPVLHFAGESKRLALSRAMAHQLTTITETSLRAAWIGHEILLQPHQAADGPAIAILPPHSARAGTSIPPQRAPEEHGWRMAMGIVAVLLIAASAYSYVYFPQLQDTLIQLLQLLQLLP